MRSSLSGAIYIVISLPTAEDRNCHLVYVDDGRDHAFRQKFVNEDFIKIGYVEGPILRVLEFINCFR